MTVTTRCNSHASATSTSPREALLAAARAFGLQPIAPAPVSSHGDVSGLSHHKVPDVVAGTVFQGNGLANSLSTSIGLVATPAAAGIASAIRHLCWNNNKTCSTTSEERRGACLYTQSQSQPPIHLQVCSETPSALQTLSHEHPLRSGLTGSQERAQSFVVGIGVPRPLQVVDSQAQVQSVPQVPMDTHQTSEDMRKVDQLSQAHSGFIARQMQTCDLATNYSCTAQVGVLNATQHTPISAQLPCAMSSTQMSLPAQAQAQPFRPEQPRPSLDELLQLRGSVFSLELCGAPWTQLLFVARCSLGHWPQSLLRELLTWPDAQLRDDGSGVSSVSFTSKEYLNIEQRLRRIADFCGATFDPLPAWVRRVVRFDPLSPAGASALGLPRDVALSKARLACANVARAGLNVSRGEAPPKVMMDYQVEGVAFGLQRGGRVLLADEMGLGKTVQALVLAAQFASEWPLLVVTPSSLRFIWREQAAQWLPDFVGEDGDLVHVVRNGRDRAPARARIVVTTYDLLRRFHTLRERTDGGDFRVIIVDESQNIKDTGSQRTKAVVGLCKAARRVILLSGTPAVNRAAELYTQLEALLPSFMPSFTKFAERYCNKDIQQFGRRVIERWTGVQRPLELHALLTGSVMIRRLKQDVLEQLPAKRRMRVPLDPEHMDQDILHEVVGQVRRLFGKCSDISQLLDEDAHSGDIGVTPNLDDAKNVGGRGKAHKPLISELFTRTAAAKLGAVVNYVEHLVQLGRKFLVFGHHHVILDALERKVCELGVACIRIDGKTSASRRPVLVGTFQDDPSVRVAVLSITAAGTGLTLTAAQLVVFAELYWVPGQMQQAEDRAHRVGQRDCVTVQYLVATETLDEIVFSSLGRKSRDTSTIMDGRVRGLELDREEEGSKRMRLDSPVGDPIRKEMEQNGDGERADTVRADD